MPDPLTKQQLGELASKFLDMHDEVDGPIYRAGFVALAQTGEHETTVIVRTSGNNSLQNLKMFNDAGVLEFAAFAQQAAQEIAALKDDEE